MGKIGNMCNETRLKYKKSQDGEELQNIIPVGSNLDTSIWNLGDKMSFLSNPKDSTNDLTRFLSRNINDEDKAILQHDNGIVEYWTLEFDSCPVRSHISLRLFVVFASSATSEHDFSILKPTMGG